MRIRMLMDYQGRLLQDRHFWHIGEEHEVEEALGEALIAEGRAESLEQPAEEVAEEVAEPVKKRKASKE